MTERTQPHHTSHDEDERADSRPSGGSKEEATWSDGARAAGRSKTTHRRAVCVRTCLSSNLYPYTQYALHSGHVVGGIRPLLTPALHIGNVSLDGGSTFLR